MGDHYVPREYLRGFGEGEFIFAFDKVKRTWPPIRPNIKNVAQETSMYRPDVEKALNVEVEAPVIKPIAKLVAREDLEPVERLALARYVVSLMRRGPSGRDRAMALVPVAANDVETRYRRDFEAMVALSPADAPKYSAAMNKVSEILARHRSNPPIYLWEDTLARGGTSMLLDAIVRMRWSALHLPPELHLFTSDYPVFHSMDVGLQGPYGEFVWPVKSQLALVGDWLQPLGRVLHQTAQAKQVREINRRTVVTANRWLFMHRAEAWTPGFLSKHIA